MKPRRITTGGLVLVALTNGLLVGCSSSTTIIVAEGSSSPSQSPSPSPSPQCVAGSDIDAAISQEPDQLNAAVDDSRVESMGSIRSLTRMPGARGREAERPDVGAVRIGDRQAAPSPAVSRPHMMARVDSHRT